MGGLTSQEVTEPFDHAAATAYRWPPDALANEIHAAGFDVIEIHTRAGSRPTPRPHGAILAQLTSDVEVSGSE
jgi:hypothetical protein